jgi:translation initiation factor IF-1
MDDSEARQPTAEGTVTELLPSQMARVSLDGKHHVTAHLGDTVHRNYIRVLVGDRVKVALMPADRTRGRIVEKL